jgi:hypothetical protein
MSQRLEDTEDPMVSQLLDDMSGLDDWISKGGFLPDQWRNVRRGRPRRIGDGDKVLDGVRHGTRHAYNQGCHCEDCTAANREAAATYRDRKKNGKKS